SPVCSDTSRTARSLTSGEYLLCLPMTPSSQESESPAIPGRFNVPLGYQFVLYRYGPFSFDLRDELTAMRVDEIIQLVPQSPPYGPRYSVMKQADYIQGLFPKTLGRFDDKIQYIAEKLGDKGVAILERQATAYYVMAKLPDASTQEQARELVRLKPHISIPEAEQAIQTIQAITQDAATKFELN
ncbi:MAG: hypothetical protein ACOZHQ_08655, partial [Thermodesulfobacteriota bacterium]